MGFFEKLFCKHNFVCYRNGPDANGFLSSFWVCTKCNKEHSKRGQAEVHPSFIANRVAPVFASERRYVPSIPSYTGRPSVSDPTPDWSTDLLNPLNPLSPLNPANTATATVNDDCDDYRTYDYLGSVRGLVADDTCRSESYSSSEPSSSCSDSSSSSASDSSSSSCSSSSSDW